MARCPPPLRSFPRGTAPERIPIVETAYAAERRAAVCGSECCDARVRSSGSYGRMDGCRVTRGEASWCGEKEREREAVGGKGGRKRDRERDWLCVSIGYLTVEPYPSLILCGFLACITINASVCGKFAASDVPFSVGQCHKNNINAYLAVNSLSTRTPCHIRARPLPGDFAETLVRRRARAPLVGGLRSRPGTWGTKVRGGYCLVP